MRTIDMQTWSRREHFNLFNAWDHPCFSMCANVDLTAFYPAVKQAGYSLTIAIVYAVAHTANAIPEFRYRIHDGVVIEHEVVHPGFTILVDQDNFSFCTVEYSDNFSQFAARAAMSIVEVKENPWITKTETDDYIYMTAIPWVTFTSFRHPMHLSPADSIPRFAWGKIFREGDCLKMPLDVQGHHAVMDGIHLGQYYQKIQDLFDQPDIYLGNV